jgi:hypothetical protein
MIYLVLYDKGGPGVPGFLQAPNMTEDSLACLHAQRFMC